MEDFLVTTAFLARAACLEIGFLVMAACLEVRACLSLSSLLALAVKLLPLQQTHLRKRTHAQTYPSTQRATQLKRVMVCVYSVSVQNLNTVNNTTVP
jgi:hypothetical protein